MLLRCLSSRPLGLLDLLGTLLDCCSLPSIGAGGGGIVGGDDAQAEDARSGLPDEEGCGEAGGPSRTESEGAADQLREEAASADVGASLVGGEK